MKLTLNHPGGKKDADVQHICKQMGRTPASFFGLLLRADGYECEYYRKD